MMDKMESIGHEMKENPPRVLAKTKRKFGTKRAEKQRRAILLSKGRRAGVPVPMPKHKGKGMKKKMRKHSSGK